MTSTFNSSSSISSTTSSLLADPILAPFLQQAFSPIAYLNSTLPPLISPATNLPGTSSQGTRDPNAIPLNQLHSKTTQLLSILDVQTYKLINHLQTLSDEILRIAPRLSYEVELLKGGIQQLHEDLFLNGSGLRLGLGLGQGKLADSVRRFPSRNDEEKKESSSPQSPSKQQDASNSSAEEREREQGQDQDQQAQPQTENPYEPPSLALLSTLSIVKSRLEQVISIFGEAMKWPLPSDISPSQGTGTTATIAKPPPSTSTATLNPQSEISYLLASNLYSQAEQRIFELRLLASIFKGTLEYQSRIELVESLEKQVKEAISCADSNNVSTTGRRSFGDIAPGRILKRGAGRDVISEAGEEEEEGIHVEREKERDGATGLREGYYGLMNRIRGFG